MGEDRLIIKGNRDGLNAVIDVDKFKDFDDILDAIVEKMEKGKRFYSDCNMKITANLGFFNERDLSKLKSVLFDEFNIESCIFEDLKEKQNKIFSGIYEGRTKFVRKTIRSGQCLNYAGNLVIIGDVNHGAEVSAGGNVIVLGKLRGSVYAGKGGNDKSIIASFSLEPEMLEIANVIARSPDDDERPQYPEVARIKDGAIIVEPYLSI